MGVLEIIAERSLGKTTLKSHPRLRLAIEDTDNAIRQTKIVSPIEKSRVVAIIELCYEYCRETDLEEKSNILRTLEEISTNEALEMPNQSIEDWARIAKR
jgi:hypothetical protein